MQETYLEGILLAYAAFAIGLFSPGPNIMAIIGTSMAHSRPSGKSLALGIATGSFLWGTITLIGLTSLLTFYASLMAVIKTAGACYLFWLAFKAFKSAGKSQAKELNSIILKGDHWAYYRRGLLIQMTNPKAALTWIAVISIALDQTAPWWVGLSVVVGTTILSAIGHLIYAYAFSTQTMVSTYRKARRWIEGLLGSFFTFAGYKLLSSDI
ncbi:LysE family translocator [Pseudovibrio sp. Ad26]|uniref:LysE family translocator n=1 Tax=Pseudovibrio sp. Ad26 TaxID=989410 RepID=UPI0007AE81A5|nr:LysE family translocator [Pseudovibrio sp. Ad26]KZK99076.1 Threonine efflux protein [Pseudovibrio sp. Ad26]